MKIFAAIVTALVFNFMFLVGLKIGYIDFYNIEIFFNSFFTKNQPLSYAAFFIPALFAFYLPKKFMLIILAALSLAALSSFIFPVQIGNKLYTQKASYQIGKHEVKDITLLYSHRGVDYVYFENLQITKAYDSKNRTK